MPKPTSKATMALITQKLTAEKQVSDSIPTQPWEEKSPEHPRSPSTASEVDSATSEQNQSNDADDVSRELDLESEEDNEDQGVSTEEESVPSDSEKPKASEKPTKEKAREPEKPEAITLDELLREAGISRPERMILKNTQSLWHPKDLLRLAPHDIITKPEYCSADARKALYIIASQLGDLGHGRTTWVPEWDIQALMTGGLYHKTFETLWHVRNTNRATSKTGGQDEFSIPKKKIALKVVPVKPHDEWVKGRDKILAELEKDSRFSKMSTSLSAYDYERARAYEGKDPTNYCTINLRAWLAECIESDVTVVSTKNRLFCDIFEEIDKTYTTLGAHITSYMTVIVQSFKLRLEPDFDNVPKFLKAATDRIEDLQDIFKNLQRKYPNAQNPEWMIPHLISYSITLEPYEDIAQQFRKKIETEDEPPTMAHAKELLELIRDKHAHRLQANKHNNSSISSSRRTTHGGGNRNSNQYSKRNSKENKKSEPHSKTWTDKIQPNKKWVDGQDKCPEEIFRSLESWEKQLLRNKFRSKQSTSRDEKLQNATDMIETLKAQNKDLKRKVGSVDLRLGRTEKAQRASNNNYKSVFVADDADEDEM